ncbi:MAG: hypothetical protein ABSF80_00190 [Chitinispirillaceae bacterium]|jgi:hypothetical protein
MMMSDEKQLVLKPNIFLRFGLVIMPLLASIGMVYGVFLRPGHTVQPTLNNWILIIGSFVFSIFIQFSFFPNFYFYINENGIGGHCLIGFNKKIKIMVRDHFEYWKQIQSVDYFDVPIIGGIMFGPDANKGLAFNFYSFTNTKAAIKILLEKLPRDKASEAADRCFFQKWERKFEKEEQKKERNG